MKLGDVAREPSQGHGVFLGRGPDGAERIYTPRPDTDTLCDVEGLDLTWHQRLAQVRTEQVAPVVERFLTQTLGDAAEAKSLVAAPTEELKARWSSLEWARVRRTGRGCVFEGGISGPDSELYADVDRTLTLCFCAEPPSLLAVVDVKMNGQPAGGGYSGAAVGSEQAHVAGSLAPLLDGLLEPT